MTKIIIPLLFCFTFLEAVTGQNINNVLISGDKAAYENIISALQRDDYLEAIISLNKFIPGYSNFGELYFMRGYAKMRLNDVSGARKDFMLATGTGYKREGLFINSMLSKKTLVGNLYKDLKQDVQLDSLRDFRPVIGPEDSLRGALRPERDCFDVYYYDLTVKILPEDKAIEGNNKIYFTTLKDTRIIQVDLFPDYRITSVNWQGNELKYTRKSGAVFIDFGKVLNAGRKEEISISYEGEPVVAKKPPWNGGFVWEKEKGRYNVGVACEHLGASSWWPNKDHLSDKVDSMLINIQVPQGYQGISNGNLVSQKEMEGGYTNFKWKVSYPINNYNVTFYMGDFVNFNEKYTNKDGDCQIDYYVMPKNLGKARKYYTATKEILQVYEKLFGLYPFRRDGVAMVEAPFEGMEHQGAIAIGGEYGKSNNRPDYNNKDFDYLLIHETAHEWWGNAVAIGDMADAWINEGFATYSEYLFAEEKFGYPEYIKVAATNQSHILNIWPVVGERDINCNTFIGNDIYTKGSAMLNNLRCIINNDTLFRGMIKDFFRKFEYKIVTTEDFVNHVKEYTHADYSDFFKIFLYETDPPVLECTYSIDRNNNLTFSYHFTNVGKNFTMPFCIAISDKEYVRLEGTSFLQTYRHEKAKTFFLVNEGRYEKDLVPHNSFTYYWTSWPMFNISLLN